MWEYNHFNILFLYIRVKYILGPYYFSLRISYMNIMCFDQIHPYSLPSKSPSTPATLPPTSCVIPSSLSASPQEPTEPT